MRVVVVGYGVQGRKRKFWAKDACVAVVDPIAEEADYRLLEDVPLGTYDAALCCVPDAPKLELLEYLLGNGKHVLVEKPLWTDAAGGLHRLQALANSNGVQCYTAYNHRFEPHFQRMRTLLADGELGTLYSCRMFYGNGTAALVRASNWRDSGAGVLPDLASHLLDTVLYWFGDYADDFHVVSASAFENESLDHVIIASEGSRPKLQLEMTLLQWRNHFTCDVLAADGSAHIRSLCKWGPSCFTVRNRVFPSGRPTERGTTIEMSDPTWQAEYAHFLALCESGAPTDLSRDVRLHKTIDRLCGEAIAMAAS